MCHVHVPFQHPVPVPLLCPCPCPTTCSLLVYFIRSCISFSLHSYTHLHVPAALLCSACILSLSNVQSASPFRPPCATPPLFCCCCLSADLLAVDGAVSVVGERLFKYIKPSLPAGFIVASLAAFSLH